MGWVSISGIFIIIWWVALFTILPLWVKRPETIEPGNASGAPEKTYIGRKLLITTLIAAAITAIIVILYHLNILNLDFVYQQ